MKTKLFVAALMAAAVCTAGVAEAQGKDVIRGSLKKDGVQYFNMTASGGTVVWLEALMDESNTDADIYVFDATDSDSRDAEDAIAIFNGTTAGYEGGAISVVPGTDVVVCLVHESGPKSRFNLVSWRNAGSGVDKGNLRVLAGLTEGGDFDLYGPVDPALAGIQRALQRYSAAKAQ
jgi:hypothetical protein